MDTTPALTAAVSAVLLALPSVVVPLRCYTRYFLVGTWNMADYCCLLAWACLIGITSIAVYALKFDIKASASDIVSWLEDIIQFEKLVNIQEIVYIPAILFTKVAVLMQLMDIFSPVRLSHRWWTLQGLIAANSIFFIFLFFIEIFECIPRDKIWTPYLPGRCININQTFVATGVVNVIDDFLILVFPISWILKLRINARKKLGICFVFGTGLL